MFIECTNCGFYLNPNEKVCSDCGLLDPNTPLLPVDVMIENQVLLKITGIIGGAAIIGLVLYRLNGSSFDFNDSFRLAFLGLLIGAVVSIIAVLLNARRSVSALEGKRFINHEKGASLQFIHDTCLLRNYELSEKRHEFRGSVKRGAWQTGERISSERRPPKNKISELLDRYDLFLNWITLARLQNQLLPLAGSQNDSSDADFFDDLDGIWSEIKGMSEGVENDFGDALSENLISEKQNFLEATEKTEKLCAALAARRKGMTRLATAFAPLTDEASTEQTEILDARRTLREISASFNNLEREYENCKFSLQRR